MNAMNRLALILTLLLQLRTWAVWSTPSLGQHQTSSFAPIQSSDGLPYRISLQPYDFGAAQLPGLHSYAAGR